MIDSSVMFTIKGNKIFCLLSITTVCELSSCLNHSTPAKQRENFGITLASIYPIHTNPHTMTQSRHTTVGIHHIHTISSTFCLHCFPPVVAPLPPDRCSPSRNQPTVREISWDIHNILFICVTAPFQPCCHHFVRAAYIG